MTEFAKRANVSASYISQLEMGKKRPNDRIIRLLSQALDVFPTQLYAAAGLIPMPLAEMLKPPNATARLDEDLTGEEKMELLQYLSFLRYRASIGNVELLTRQQP